jgi:hypothetical protein
LSAGTNDRSDSATGLDLVQVGVAVPAVADHQVVDALAVVAEVDPANRVDGPERLLQDRAQAVVVVRLVRQQVDLGLLEHGPHADARVVAEHEAHVLDHLARALDEVVGVAHAVVEREHLPDQEPHLVAHRVEAVLLNVAPDADRVDLHLEHLREVVGPHLLVRLAHPLARDVAHAAEEDPLAVQVPLARIRVRRELLDAEPLLDGVPVRRHGGGVQVRVAEVPGPPQPGVGDREDELVRRPAGLKDDAPGTLVRLAALEVVGPDRQREVGLDHVPRRVADGHVRADERRAVGPVPTVAEPVLPDADLREELHVVDVHARSCEELDAVPDAAGVAVRAERGHRARPVHRVDHVALDRGGR